MSHTDDQYRARRAFLEFQDKFMELKESVQFVLPLAMFRDYQQMDAACRQFFDAANEHMFSKATSRFPASNEVAK